MPPHPALIMGRSGKWRGQFPASLDQIVTTSVSTSQGTPTTTNHQQLVEARKDPPRGLDFRSRLPELQENAFLLF